jgi:hypothetical protein
MSSEWFRAETLANVKILDVSEQVPGLPPSRELTNTIWLVAVRVVHCERSAIENKPKDHVFGFHAVAPQKI